MNGSSACVPYSGTSSCYEKLWSRSTSHHHFKVERTLYNNPDIRRLHNPPGVPQKLRARIASIIAPAVPDARKTVLIVHARYGPLIRAKGVAVRLLRTMIMLVEGLLRGISGTSGPAAVVEIAEEGPEGGDAGGEDCEVELQAAIAVVSSGGSIKQ